MQHSACVANRLSSTLFRLPRASSRRLSLISLPWPHRTLRRPHIRSYGDVSRPDGEHAPPPFFNDYKKSYNIKPTFELGSEIDSQYVGQKVTVVGFLSSTNSISSSMTFAKLVGVTNQPLLKNMSKPRELQVLFRRKSLADRDQALEHVKSINVGSSVAVTGTLKIKQGRYLKLKDDEVVEKVALDILEVRADKIDTLNPFPDHIIIGENSNYGPESRHLQIRFDPALRYRLAFRHTMMAKARDVLRRDFLEIETPILFKSTPEGAREFLVPTRKPGYAYALPQSPQQYKQILMASGISKYFQFARCFRDEDFRADRQPEFTQLDLEMSWADGHAVMSRVEQLIHRLYTYRGTLPKYFDRPEEQKLPLHSNPARIPRMTYEEAMNDHGCDKPDLRNRDLIHRIDHLLPESLARMLTSLEGPIIEMWKISPRAPDTFNLREIKNLIGKFMDSADAAVFKNNPDGAPGVFVVDSSKPLKGLSAFGFQGVENLEQHFDKLHKKRLLYKTPKPPSQGLETKRPSTASLGPSIPEFAEPGVKTQISATEDSNSESTRQDAGPTSARTFVDGEIIILQARPNRAPTGDSTMLGKLRRAIFKLAVTQGFVKADRPRALWVTDFPLFTKNEGSVEPGQGGSAGISSTHHPFTAPKTAEDVDLLLTDPLKAKADHYDLVIDGVELGGGSRRIHSAEMQEFIMRDILKMPPERVKDFDHLLGALRAGCPPHAGFALGWDRLMAMMLGCDSIRDVMAFPKNSRGEDLLVGSPGKVTREQAETYHMEVKDT